MVGVYRRGAPDDPLQSDFDSNMACCNKNQLLAGVALLDGLQDYNMGTCVKQRHLAIYNAEVRQCARQYSTLCDHLLYFV